MKFVLALVLFLSPAALAPVVAQQFKLVEFHMAVLRSGPNASLADTEEGKKIHSQHRAYVEELIKSGKMVLGGPFADDGEVKGIMVYRAKDAAEAKAWAEDNPSVKAGHVVVEMHPWWSADVMKPATIPLKFTKAYFAFLTRGEKWTPERTPQTEAVQKAHLANINRLAEMKKLVVAGPFGDNGRLRGIFVFKVATLEEAKELANTDPAVQAGRLALDVRPWLVFEGMLP